jgi:hypothetical protein
VQTLVDRGALESAAHGLSDRDLATILIKEFVRFPDDVDGDKAA